MSEKDGSATQSNNLRLGGRATEAPDEPDKRAGLHSIDTAPLLEVRESAALIGVSRATFWKLHSSGRVPLPVRLSERVVR